MNEIQFILYQLPDEEGKVQVVIKDETIWATQKAMAQLFDVNIPAISKHLKNIFDEGELSPDATVSKMEIVQMEGEREVKRETSFYSLDAIIAVGYRVSSVRATRFRQWATKILNEYIRKGFVLDDERLKQGTAVFGKDYFRELLERVRSIRASERRIWQQITDIYAECSIDYDRQAQTTRDFYAMIQNRFHYAITGQTAAEIIYTNADHTKENMGLTTWKNAPEGRILKSDVGIAKNYLPEQKIRQLERAVTGFFDYIEDLIERENTFNMEQFSASVNEFLSFRRYKILPDKGHISAQQAKEKEQAKKNAKKAKKQQPAMPSFSTYPKMLLEVLDWLIDQNADAKSEYYHCLNLDRVAAMGQSCGGAQVLGISHDPRIKTCVMLNTGIGDMEMMGTTKENLKNLHQPMFYMIGGPGDIAYANAQKDYDRIADNIPVVMLNSKDGHSGTYYEKHGGNYAKAVVKWLDWQLKGQVGQSALFLDDDYLKMKFPEWQGVRKNF